MHELLNLNSFVATIERITFSNEENGYSILKVRPLDFPRHKITVIAQRIGLVAGTIFDFHGTWIKIKIRNAV
jgi:exodeoxyribonuclease V alpha subunit